jgi:hypothetical protein
LRGEIVVQGDGVHMPGPDQQRIRRIRSAEIAVAAAFDDQPQIIVASEIDCSDDVTRLVSRHRIDARLRFPGIYPARGLRQGDVVADEIGILEFLEEIAARRPIGCFATSTQRRVHLDEPAADSII